jgi:hypothetical protein
MVRKDPLVLLVLLVLFLQRASPVHAENLVREARQVLQDPLGWQAQWACQAFQVARA